MALLMPLRQVISMISGVLFVLFGEALILRSWPHSEWAVVFALADMIYIPVVEEPMLASRFGESYDRYKKAVPRPW